LIGTEPELKFELGLLHNLFSNTHFTERVVGTGFHYLDDFEVGPFAIMGEHKGHVLVDFWIWEYRGMVGLPWFNQYRPLTGKTFIISRAHHNAFVEFEVLMEEFNAHPLFARLGFANPAYSSQHRFIAMWYPAHADNGTNAQFKILFIPKALQSGALIAYVGNGPGCTAVSFRGCILVVIKNNGSMGIFEGLACIPFEDDACAGVVFALSLSIFGS